MDTNSYVIALAALWGAAGLFLIARKQLSFGVLVFLAGALGAAALNDTARPYALGVLPALGLHIVAALPDGSLPTRARRNTVIVGYVLGVALAVYLGTAKAGLVAPVAPRTRCGWRGWLTGLVSANRAAPRRRPRPSRAR